MFTRWDCEIRNQCENSTFSGIMDVSNGWRGTEIRTLSLNPDTFALISVTGIHHTPTRTPTRTQITKSRAALIS